MHNETATSSRQWLFGWCLGWWTMTEVPTSSIWLVLRLASMLSLITLFGTAAYKTASHLRGALPRQFTWITEAKYAGP